MAIVSLPDSALIRTLIYFPAKNKHFPLEMRASKACRRHGAPSSRRCMKKLCCLWVEICRFDGDTCWQKDQIGDILLECLSFCLAPFRHQRRGGGGARPKSLYHTQLHPTRSSRDPWRHDKRADRRGGGEQITRFT